MNITVYTVEGCPWCAKVKEYLKSKNKEFNEIDVSLSKDAAREMVQKSGQKGVPVTDIDGNLVIGYNSEDLDRYIGA